MYNEYEKPKKIHERKVLQKMRNMERYYKTLCVILAVVLLVIFLTLAVKIDWLRVHRTDFLWLTGVAVAIGILSVSLLPSIIEKIDNMRENREAKKEAALKVEAQKAAEAAKEAEKREEARNAALVEAVKAVVAEAIKSK